MNCVSTTCRGVSLAHCTYINIVGHHGLSHRPSITPYPSCSPSYSGRQENPICFIGWIALPWRLTVRSAPLWDLPGDAHCMIGARKSIALGQSTSDSAARFAHTGVGEECRP